MNFQQWKVVHISETYRIFSLETRSPDRVTIILKTKVWEPEDYNAWRFHFEEDSISAFIIDFGWIFPRDWTIEIKWFSIEIFQDLIDSLNDWLLYLIDWFAWILLTIHRRCSLRFPTWSPVLWNRGKQFPRTPSSAERHGIGDAKNRQKSLVTFYFNNNLCLLDFPFILSICMPFI